MASLGAWTCASLMVCFGLSVVDDGVCLLARFAGKERELAMRCVRQGELLKAVLFGDEADVGEAAQLMRTYGPATEAQVAWEHLIEDARGPGISAEYALAVLHARRVLQARCALLRWWRATAVEGRVSTEDAARELRAVCVKYELPMP